MAAFPPSHGSEMLKRDLYKSWQPCVELVWSAGLADLFVGSSLFVSINGGFVLLKPFVSSNVLRFLVCSLWFAPVPSPSPGSLW